MGDGVVVPIDKLDSTADAMKALGTSAGEIADALKDADPPEVLWGALGLLLKGRYEEKAAEARDHITKISEALNSHCGALRETANRYKQLDEALEQAFKRFQQKLDGGR